MRKLFAFFAFFLLASCNEVGVEEQSAVETNYEFYAYAPGYNDDSRTYVDENYGLHWINDDRITIFHGMLEPLQFAFMGETGSKSGKYYNVDGIFYAPDPDAPNNVAIYPYSANHVLEETTRAVTLEMPAVQNYTENSFGQNANTMVAITSDVFDTALYFKNVGSYLNVRLWGANQTVKSITITATGGEALSGAAKVTPVYGGDPTCEMLAEGSSPSVKLVCAEPIVVNTTSDQPVSFWMVLPPVTMASGLTATVENAEGQTQIFEITKSVTFARNKYNTLTREMTIEDLSAKQIIYTSTDGEVVTPADATAFNATIVSNTYENGKGVILFEEDVTTIGAGAFKGCATLEDITIPEGVTEIGDEAFKECASLKYFYGYGASEDGRCLIQNGKLISFAPANLYTYIIPSGITEIAATTFANCDELVKVVIPEGVVKIGWSAFAQCDKLAEVTLPSTIEWSADRQFGHCPSLTKFIGTSVSEDGRCIIADNVLIAFAPSGLTTYTIPSGVTEVGYYAFCDANELESVVIPESVTVIGESAFCSCDKLTTATLPKSVKTIKNYAFAEANLTGTVVIPASVETIEEYAFHYNLNLEKVECYPTTPPTAVSFYQPGVWHAFGLPNVCNIPQIYVPAESLEAYKTADKWNYYADYIVAMEPEPVDPTWQIRYTGTKQVYASGNFGAKMVSNTWDSTTGEGVITFDGKVTSIGKEAFSEDTNLTSIVIPDGVTAIYTEAFYCCSNLAQVTLPKALKTIGESVFYRCSALTQINIPATVTSIDEGGFSSCYNLKRVDITDLEAWCKISFQDDGYGNGGKYANPLFNGADLYLNGELVKDLVIPESITTINGFSFCGGTFETITMHDQVSYIGEQAFAYCQNISEVTIAAGVRKICWWAFSNCPNLKTVICKPTTPPTGTLWNSSDWTPFTKHADLKIYVPNENYKTMWSDYKSYMVVTDTSVL